MKRLVLIAAMAVGCDECDETTAPACCRVCTQSKACGDSCIPVNQTCNVGPGCACNGFTGGE